MYKTRKTDKFFYNNYSIVEREIDFSCTVTFSHLVNLTAVENIRKLLPSGNRPTYTAFLAKAAAVAVEQFKYANRRFYRPLGILPRRFQEFESVDIAVASEVDIPGVEYCAFIDIVRDVQDKSLTEVADWLKQMRTETELNKQWRIFSTLITRWPKILAKMLIRLPVFFPSLWAKYRGGAILISSPAKYGVDSVLTSWSSPIGLSYGEVKERPLVENGSIVAAPTFYLTMNFDRRLMAGAQAARFFRRLVQALENAEMNLSTLDTMGVSKRDNRPTAPVHQVRSQSQ